MALGFVGTGHVLEKSVREVNEAIHSQRPDIVAVELDIRRFRALESVSFDPEARAEALPLGVFLKDFVRRGGSFPVLIQYFLGLIQQDLGRRYGIHPGSDMCAAINGARFYGAKVALIDRDIEVTLNRFFTIPLKEVLGFFRKTEEAEAISGILVGNIEAILEKENLAVVMEKLKKEAPKTYCVFVDERDQHMAGVLHGLREQNLGKNILAVVGAGHLSGIKEHMKRIDNGEKIDLDELARKKAVNPIKALAVVSLLAVALFLTKAQSITQKR